MTVKLANAISIILSYPLIGFAEILFLCYVNSVDSLLLALGVFLHSFAPIVAPIIYGRLIERGDYFVSNRSHRPILFIPGILAYFLAFYLFYSYKLFEIASLEFVCMLTSIVLAIITMGWKISIHTASIAIPITFFPLLGYLEVLIFSPLLILVGWARMKVKAHSVAQVAGGAVIGFTCTLTSLALLKSINYVCLIL
ncbi:MAG: hypothetical protein NDF55_01035 [archaeon GB-1867-005]|nr:hypothetical protein [Candidatus Culexmicrobium cathedralense]